MMNILKKINIKPSFYCLIIFAIFFQVAELMLHTIIFVGLHELAHIIVAKKLGLSISKIVVSPLGMNAIINDFDNTYLYKKIMITSAGVIFNIIISMIFYNYEYIRNLNLSIAFFNILPILPLDGGKLYNYVLGNIFGDLNALKFMIKTSKVFSSIILILGIIQIILMPYNISLFTLALYFMKTNDTIYLSSLHKSLTQKFSTHTKIFKIREYFVDENYPNSKLLCNFSCDYICIIKFHNSNNKPTTSTITERQFMLYVNDIGLIGNIKDVADYLHIYNTFDDTIY